MAGSFDINRPLNLKILSLFAVLVAGSIGVAIVEWQGRVETADPEFGVKLSGPVAIARHKAEPVFGGDLRFKCQLPVKNWWDRSVSFSTVVPSCACSKAKIAKETLLPGEVTELFLEIEFPPVGGERSVSCELRAETGEIYVHYIEAVAYPVLQLATEDEVVEIGSMQPGEFRRSTEDLISYASDDTSFPRIIGARCSSSQVALDVLPLGVPEPIEDGSGLFATSRLDLQISAATRPGRYAADVEIEYEISGGSGRAHALVSWEVKSLFRTEPSRVYLGPDEVQSEFEVRKVHLSSLDGAPFRILAIDAGASWVEVEPPEERTSGNHEITLRIMPSGLSGQAAFTELDIQVNHKQQQAVTVPISLAATGA